MRPDITLGLIQGRQFHREREREREKRLDLKQGRGSQGGKQPRERNQMSLATLSPWSIQEASWSARQLPSQKRPAQARGGEKATNETNTKRKGRGAPSSQLLSYWALLSASVVLLNVRSILNFKFSAYLRYRRGGVGRRGGWNPNG